jgi:outer membrane protein assembly factor BamE (lipoprotein component of BamABCDE complex)
MGGGGARLNSNDSVVSSFDLLWRRAMRSARPCSTAVAISTMLAAGACGSDVVQLGDLPTQNEIAQIHPGKTTKDQVVKILGSPSSVGIFDPNAWYYISKRTSQPVLFLQPSTTDQQVYIVDFNKDGVVSAVDHKGLKDAEDVRPAPGATPAPGRELTFLEQVIGNLGRFSGGNSGGGGGGSGAATPNPAGPSNGE